MTAAFASAAASFSFCLVSFFSAATLSFATFSASLASAFAAFSFSFSASFAALSASFALFFFSSTALALETAVLSLSTQSCSSTPGMSARLP